MNPNGWNFSISPKEEGWTVLIQTNEHVVRGDAATPDEAVAAAKSSLPKPIAEQIDEMLVAVCGSPYLL